MKEKRNGEERIDDVETSGEVRGGGTPTTRGARVYERPERGGRSTLTWLIVALVLLVLALWLLF